MAWLALALWGIYGAGALGVRVVQQVRRTGSTGLVGSKAPLGSIAWVAENLHLVAIGLGLAAPVLDLAGVLAPIGVLDDLAVHVVGVVVFGVGLLGVMVGQAQMGDAWRIGTDPGESTELVTTGLYAYVRNPIYSFLVPTLGGLALVIPNAASIASVALFVVAFQIETRVIEEPHLARVHGDVYADWASHTGRFLPGVGKLDKDRPVPD